MTSPKRRRQGFWLTAGEIVGVLALIIAALNFWDTHSQRVQEVRQRSAQAAAMSALVLAATPEDGGRRLALSPVKSEQVVQSQRFVFPSALGAAPRDIVASRPRIEAAWVAGPLSHALNAAHASGSGDARLPLAVRTVFVENGETRQDLSLYDLGYSWKRRLLGGDEIRLQGLALISRQLNGDPQRPLDARWTRQRPAGKSD